MQAQKPTSKTSIGVGHKKDFGIFGKTPSLDPYGQNSTNYSEWSRGQRRCYQRLKSGLTRHRGERLRFITLTTPEEPKRELPKAFEVLKQRIRRIGIKKLEKEGYLKKGDIRKFYEGRYKIGLSFDYLKVETWEGANGVYHILYFGDYIPQRWLSDQWEDIIGARVVDIRATKRGVGNTRKLASYCIGQYCAGQSGFVRYSWSWNWVFRGFVRVWKWVIESVGLRIRRGIELWERILSGERLVYEQNGWCYSIGDDPPYVRMSVSGTWINALGEERIKLFYG